MKRWGLLTGAVLGAIAVWAFYALTTVSDDDLLTEALAEHCLPYVQSGAQPFESVGRSPGVYDAVTARSSITDGGVRLLFDGRFQAHWGLVEGAGRQSRICEITPASGHAVPPAFRIDGTGFIERYTRVIGVAADLTDIESSPTAVGWYEIPSDQSRGLRVVMIVVGDAVGNVVVMDDLNG